MGDQDNQDLGHSNHSNHSSHSKKSNRKDPITIASVLATIRSYLPEHIFTPVHFHLHKPHREYDLTVLQRIFVMIEEADSCILGVMISAIMAGLIVLGVILYVLANDPSFTFQPKECDINDPSQVACYDTANCPGRVVCAPIPEEWIDKVEYCILIIFTIEFGAKILICPFMPARLLGLLPSPEEMEDPDDDTELEIDMPWWKKLICFSIDVKALIDWATILPFYILKGGKSFNFIRVLRLARVLHVLKLSKGNAIIHILEVTMQRSMSALALVGFVGGLLMVLLGSIVFYLEQGNFMVNPEYPEGAYLRWNVLHDHMEKSPFVSLQESLYWSINTMTNTGYGDLIPTSTAGRVVANVAMVVGVIICGLPIGVLGSNFSHEYDLYMAYMKHHHSGGADGEHHGSHKNEALTSIDDIHIQDGKNASSGFKALPSTEQTIDHDGQSVKTVAAVSPHAAAAAAATGTVTATTSARKDKVKELRAMVESLRELQINYMQQQQAISLTLSSALDELKDMEGNLQES